MGVVGDMVGDRPAQPVPVRAFGQVEHAAAVSPGDEGGVPELDVGVGEGHFDLVVRLPESGVPRADGARDSDVLAPVLRADAGQGVNEPDLHDQVSAGGRGCQRGVGVVEGRTVIRRHRVVDCFRRRVGVRSLTNTHNNTI